MYACVICYVCMCVCMYVICGRMCVVCMCVFLYVCFYVRIILTIESMARGGCKGKKGARHSFRLGMTYVLVSVPCRILREKDSTIPKGRIELPTAF